MEKNKSAEEFIRKHSHWSDVLTSLRQVFLSTELEETIKWGVPVYTLDGKNVAGLAAFKHHAAIWFFQGALLQDKSAQLVNAQKGITQAQRQWRFESLDDVNTELVRKYVNEAIDNQKLGKKIKPPRKKTLLIPEELTSALQQDCDLQSSFDTLSPYRQREYSEYISTAKRVATRESRLAKIIPMIREGIGLNDKYRCK